MTLANNIPPSIALVTGASSGIGKATVRQLLANGFVVFAGAPSLESINDLEDDGAIILPLDLTDHQQIDRVSNEIEHQYGRLDVLVNNAGMATFGALEDISLKEARHQFEVNLFGHAMLTKSVLPMMKERRRGKIFNISSIGGKIYTPLGSWYHAAKHALEGWSDCLRLELATFNLDVILIEPGIIQTEFGERARAELLENSGLGDYSKLARKQADAIKKAFSKAEEARPELVAQVIARAIRTKRPRTRYATGKYARRLLLLRKWCGDRIFDRAIQNFAT